MSDTPYITSEIYALDILQPTFITYLSYGVSISLKMARKMQNLNESELQDLRMKINERERKRMHDLNSALDGLRKVCAQESV